MGSGWPHVLPLWGGYYVFCHCLACGRRGRSPGARPGLRAERGGVGSLARVARAGCRARRPAGGAAAPRAAPRRVLPRTARGRRRAVVARRTPAAPTELRHAAWGAEGQGTLSDTPAGLEPPSDCADPGGDGVGAGPRAGAGGPRISCDLERPWSLSALYFFIPRPGVLEDACEVDSACEKNASGNAKPKQEGVH